MNNLKNIKIFLKKNKINACLISKNNQYLNEITSPSENLLLKITGFTGSLGYALIYQHNNNLYVDGRYHQQAKIQSKKFIVKDISVLKKDLSLLLNNKKKLLVDPRTFSYNFFEKYKCKNLVFFNSLRIKKSNQNISSLTKNYCGQETSEKIKKVRSKINLKKDEAFLITSPENIGWLGNIRVLKKKYNKNLNCLAILEKNRFYIFVDFKINSKMKHITFKSKKNFEFHLSKYKKLYVDKNYTNLYYVDKLNKKKINISFFNDPIDKFKSIKNSTEISNFKIAHIFDGIAYIKFLYWLKCNKLKKISERDCQKKIEFFKNKNKYYLGPSFDSIAATEKNASIIHYNAQDYKKTYLKKNDLLLFDSGSHYMFGTTDMTRTISLGRQSFFRKKIYTLVLKSHIAVSTVKIKKTTTGQVIDRVARKKLLELGYNYNHGTGHGVGYLSNVHENYPSLSKFSNDKIYINQVTSNEPGFYKKDDFGIRLENLIFFNHNRIFEDLTLVPFENSMIVKSMLTKKEKKWINNYHDNVYEKIHKFLKNNEKKFLKNYCLKID